MTLPVSLSKEHCFPPADLKSMLEPSCTLVKQPKPHCSLVSDGQIQPTEPPTTSCLDMLDMNLETCQSFNPFVLVETFET